MGYERGVMKLDKVQYWLDLADDDIPAVKSLLNGGSYLHAGFFCHLIAEKALKAVIEHKMNETPPKIHDLRKLAAKSGIFDKLSEDQIELLKALEPLQIEARYPEYKTKISKTLTKEIIEKIYKETEDFLCWIKKELEK